MVPKHAGLYLALTQDELPVIVEVLGERPFLVIGKAVDSDTFELLESLEIKEIAEWGPEIKFPKWGTK